MERRGEGASGDGAGYALAGCGETGHEPFQRGRLCQNSHAAALPLQLFTNLCFGLTQNLQRAFIVLPW